MGPEDPGRSGGRPARRGHHSIPHTADLRVEAWGESREECLAEAVLGVCESFADTAGAKAGDVRPREVVVRAEHDEDLLVDLLEEVLYRLDTGGEVPVDAEVTAVPGGVKAVLRMADAEKLEIIGAVPKAVTLNGLVFARGPEGWRCSVTMDV